MTESSKTGFPSFSFEKKNLAILGVLAVLLVGGVAAQTTTKAVTLGDNGIKLFTGTLDVNGQDIEDAGTTIWDQSNGYIPKAQIQNLVASDVGLGNVENIALSTIGGNDITWDSGNSELDVDSSSIQLGTTATDVGLGNVENENALAQDGSETLNGNLDLGSNSISNINSLNNNDNKIVIDQSNDIELRTDETSNEVDNRVEFYNDNDATPYGYFNNDFGNPFVHAQEDVSFDAGDDGNTDCSVNTDGSLSCSGSKDWVHDLENGSEAVYSSQESPEVRAVYEGKTSVDGETRVEVPEHFSMTVSDTEPKLRATATVQGKLAYAAVIEKTDDYIVLDSSEPATVNYRITGIREGYEDKQVVRPKEE